MGEIIIVGLGPGEPRHLTAAAWAALRRCSGKIYVQNLRHPALSYCRSRGLRIRTMERLLRAKAPPEQAARAAGRVILAAAGRQPPICFAVPGNPLESGDGAVEYLRLRAPRCGHRVTIIPGISLFPVKGSHPLRELEQIMTLLRSPRGCPWDRRQTHLSLRGCLIEEAYEVVAAIERGDPAALEEELGDLLLQVVFHSELAREKGRFDLENVIHGISAKLIRRHPHVFESSRAATAAQADGSWEKAKELERGAKKGGAIPIDAGLPALLGAYKVQQRAAALGFDWPSLEGAVEKLREEAAELQDAYRQGERGKIEEEFGDFLFSAVNVARFLDLNPELALGKALRKFLDRFAYIAARVAESKLPFCSHSLDQLDRWWKEAKNRGENAFEAGNYN